MSVDVVEVDNRPVPKTEEAKLLEKYPGLNFLKQNPDVEGFAVEELENGLRVNIACREGLEMRYELERNELTREKELFYGDYYNEPDAGHCWIMQAKALSITIEGETTDLVASAGEGINIVIDIDAPHLRQLPEALRDDYWARNMYVYHDCGYNGHDPKKRTLTTPLVVSTAGLAMLAHEYGHFRAETKRVEEKKVHDLHLSEMTKREAEAEERGKVDQEAKRKISELEESWRNRDERAADYFGLLWLRKINGLRKEKMGKITKFMEIFLQSYENARETKGRKNRASSNPKKYAQEYKRMIDKVSQCLKDVYEKA